MKKQDLLRTTDDTKEITVSGFSKEKGDNGTVDLTIRPLSDKEMTEAESIALKGVNFDKDSLNAQTADKVRKMKNKGLDNKKIAQEVNKSLSGVNIDIEEFLNHGKQSTYIIAAYGLSCNGEDWEPDEVGQLPPGIPDEIAEKVRQISDPQLFNEEDEENF